MRKFLSFLAIAILLPYANDAQSLVLNNVDKYLKDYQSKIPIPGFSIVIVEGNEVIFEKAYGVKREGNNRPMTSNAPMNIGSIGRGFTSLAVMQLVEKGLIALDTPVVTYLPWFKTANKEFSDQITLRMCLSNTSGIPPQFESLPYLESQNSVESFVRSFESFFIKRKPGMSHEFCDEGYSIADLIISQVSGLTYSDYVTQNILEPLEMRNSAIGSHNAKSLNIIRGHELGLEKCIPAIKERSDPNFIASGSEIYSCTSDLGNYMIALLNGGKYKNEQLLSAQGIEELFKSNTSFQGLGTMLGGNGIDIQYALGWMGMEIEERDILIHTGSDGKVGAIIGLNRDKHQAFAMLFNADVNNFDRFEYPGMENTVNNVIHVLNGEETTDFGVVRDIQFNEEDFILPKDKWKKYIGQYESFGQSSPFFKDMNIEVFVGTSGELELISRKEKVFKGHYKLEFTNESRAILRNIAQPRQIQFTIFPDGFVGGLFMFGSEFKKKNKENESRFIRVYAMDKKVSFSLPKNVKTKWNKNHLLAKLSEDESATLKLSIANLKEEMFEDFISDHIEDKTITSKGNINKSAVKDGIWTEQSVFVSQNGKSTQNLFAFYQDPISQKQIQMVIECPWGEYSSSINEIIQNMQRTMILE